MRIDRRRPGRGAWGLRLLWLRGRLLPRGDPLVLVSYAMILAAFITAAVARWGGPSPWRLGGGLLALAGMFIVQLYQPTLEENISRRGVGRPYLLLTAGFLLLATWLVPSYAVTLLFFMVSAQAFAWLRPADALLLVVPLLAALVAVQGLIGVARPANLIVEYALGGVFTGMFSLVITNYYEQRTRAEGLARQLGRANAELTAARARETELAAVTERVRIARDMHDGLGHHLTVLAVQLQAAEKLLARDPPQTATLIANCRREARAALDEVRRSVDVMRRSPLEDRPLDEALRQLVGEFAARSSVAAQFARAGEATPLAPAAATTLYRVAQEGLTNAQKYAAASRVTVTLTYAPPIVRLTVRDEGGAALSGSAPDPDDAPGGGRVGLRGLRERAEALGGTFAAGHDATGFVVAVTLPSAGGDAAGAAG